MASKLKEQHEAHLQKTKVAKEKKEKKEQLQIQKANKQPKKQVSVVPSNTGSKNPTLLKCAGNQMTNCGSTITTSEYGTEHNEWTVCECFKIFCTTCADKGVVGFHRPFCESSSSSSSI